MSKIVSAVNAMLENKEKISQVLRGGDSDEVFFIYDLKHKWSISNKGDGEYVLYYYSIDWSIEQLSRVEPQDWQHIRDYVVYKTESLGTREARESFADLYMLISEKVLGMDDVLDDIISTAIPF